MRTIGARLPWGAWHAQHRLTAAAATAAMFAGPDRSIIKQSYDARERLQRRFMRFEARQRQIAAVLAAHGVPVQFVHCPVESDCRAALV